MSEYKVGARGFEMEKTLERFGRYVADFGDLGLGATDGIPSEYAGFSKEHLNEIAEGYAERLVTPTDLTATACIDGRRRLGNMDESTPEVRLRRVGGSASDLGVALNAQSSVIDIAPSHGSPLEQADFVSEYIETRTGFEQSAHMGGCGGANGEIDDDVAISGEPLGDHSDGTTEDYEAIHDNPVVLAAAKTFLEIEEVNAFFAKGHEEGLDGSTVFDDDLADLVRVNAKKTALYLTEAGWNGQDYVKHVKEHHPRTVEDLEVDSDDHKYHGHKERSLIVIIGENTADWPDDFVWNLLASKKVAEALAGQRGIDGYKQAVIAEVAKHMAVGLRLPSKTTPIFLVGA